MAKFGVVASVCRRESAGVCQDGTAAN